jgi:hypothetical protein
MPKRKKLPKSPVMMKLKRNGPNDFKWHKLYSISWITPTEKKNETRLL